MDKTDEVYVDEYRCRWTDRDMIEFSKYISFTAHIPAGPSDEAMKDILLDWVHSKHKNR